MWPGSPDESLLEAAAGLGARPINAFATVTLPVTVTVPGIIAGSLLMFIPATGEYVVPDLPAFTLSLDDLVIASFVTGPGSSTLPILIYSRNPARPAARHQCAGDDHHPDRRHRRRHRGLADAAAAEDCGGRGGRPPTGPPMATAGDEHYPLDSILFLEALWGDGFLSPGGPEEVERLLSGMDLRGRDVVDIGSGAGGIPILLADRYGAARVIGLDVEATMVAHARAKVERAGLQDRIEIRKVEPGPMPLPDAGADIVFSKDSIVHIPDKEALAADAFRVLKPGGWFVASDWLISHDGEPSPEMADYIAKEDLDFGMASPARYRRALEAAGFVDVSLTNRNPWYRTVRARRAGTS